MNTNKYFRSASLFLALAVLFLFTVSVSAASLTAPIISVAPDTYYPLDERLYIEGAAPVGKTIDLLFDKPGSQPIRVSVRANSNGEWFYSDKLELASGEWMVRARTLDDSGDNPSDWSNPRIVRSVVSGFVIGSLKVKYIPIILILSFLLLGATCLFTYSALRVRTIRRLETEKKMEEETKRLRKALQKERREATGHLIEERFADLRKSILEEMEHLDRQYHEGKLSKEEEVHRVELMRQLRQIEGELEKGVRKTSD